LFNNLSQSSVKQSKKARTLGKTRWWVVWTLFFSTVTNYISRQTFSVLSPMIAAQYHLSHTDLAKLSSAVADGTDFASLRSA
jgi:MFS transporter, ACS family, hexuronate transporter